MHCTGAEEARLLPPSWPPWGTIRTPGYWSLRSRLESWDHWRGVPGLIRSGLKPLHPQWDMEAINASSGDKLACPCCALLMASIRALWGPGGNPDFLSRHS